MMVLGTAVLYLTMWVVQDVSRAPSISTYLLAVQTSHHGPHPFNIPSHVVLRFCGPRSPHTL